MSKKGNKKAQAMNLTDFTGDKRAGETGDNLDWAEDDWEDEEKQLQEQALHASGAGGRLFGRKAGAMDDFRSAAVEQLTTVVPEDMVAPFVAHVANLPNTITDEQLEEAFADMFTVIAVNVVKRPKTTFGYVEVLDREQLQAVILQTGRNVGGRKIRVDVATEQQIERFKGQGKEQFPGLSRDAIGAEQQPEFRGSGLGRGMKSSASMGEFSRDAMGSAQEGGEGGFGGFGGGLGSADDLGDFRSAGPVAQPPAPSTNGNERGGRGNWRGKDSKPASPNVQSEPADFGGWRDGPVATQPTAPGLDEKKGEKKAWKGKGSKDSSPTSKDAPNNGGAWRRGGDEPAKAEPKAEEKKPKEEKKPAWGPKKTIQQKPQQKNEPAPVENNRFAAFRK